MKLDLTKSPCQQTNLKNKYPDFTVRGSFTTIFFRIDKNTLKHTALQSVSFSDFKKLYKKLKYIEFLKSEHFLHLKNVFFKIKPSPLYSLEYESCVSPLNDYISLIKSAGAFLGKFFSDKNLNGWLKKIYTKDATNFNFNIKDVSVNFINQLFLMVNFLRYQKLNKYFYLSNIFITYFGRLKLFPGIKNSETFINMRDPEDILEEWRKEKVEFNDEKRFSSKIYSQFEVDKSGFLRNAYNAGLISVQIIFRDWSPFRTLDLPEVIIDEYNVVSQDLWTVQSTYNTNINKNFILTGLKRAASDEETHVKDLFEVLANVFKPRNERLLNELYMEKIAIRNLTIFPNIENCIKILEKHSLTSLCENQNNFNNEESVCSPNKKMKCGENESVECSLGLKDEDLIFPVNEDVNESLGKDSQIPNDYKGIDNWMEDSISFMESFTAPTDGVEESCAVENESKVNEINQTDKCAWLESSGGKCVAKELKGVENWMDSSTTFLQPCLNTSSCGNDSSFRNACKASEENSVCDKNSFKENTQHSQDYNVYENWMEDSILFMQPKENDVGCDCATSSLKSETEQINECSLDNVDFKEAKSSDLSVEYRQAQNWMEDSTSFVDSSPAHKSCNETSNAINNENKLEESKLFSDISFLELNESTPLQEEYKGIENWMEDSMAFIQPSPRKQGCGCVSNSIKGCSDFEEETEKTCMREESQCSKLPKEYQAFENWMEDSITFIQPVQNEPDCGDATDTQNEETDIIDSGSISKEAEFPKVPDEYKGIEDWIEDSTSFIQPDFIEDLSDIKDESELNEPNLCNEINGTETAKGTFVPEEYKGLINWIEDSASFIPSIQNKSNRDPANDSFEFKEDSMCEQSSYSEENKFSNLHDEYKGIENWMENSNLFVESTENENVSLSSCATDCYTKTYTQDQTEETNAEDYILDKCNRIGNWMEDSLSLMDKSPFHNIASKVLKTDKERKNIKKNFNTLSSESKREKFANSSASIFDFEIKKDFSGRNKSLPTYQTLHSSIYLDFKPKKSKSINIEALCSYDEQSDIF